MPRKKALPPISVAHSPPVIAPARKRTATAGKPASRIAQSAAPAPELKHEIVSEPRTGSKLARIVDGLRQPAGASVPELMVETGWRAHTVRAALTGLRQRGFTVVRAREDESTRYRISPTTGAVSDQEIAA
jgi:hypothetical protein